MGACKLPLQVLLNKFHVLHGCCHQVLVFTDSPGGTTRSKTKTFVERAHAASYATEIMQLVNERLHEKTRGLIHLDGIIRENNKVCHVCSSLRYASVHKRAKCELIM